MLLRYVKTGLAGYGPDLDSEDEPFETTADVAAAIVWELNSYADYLEQGASGHAEQEDWEAAWKAHAKADELATLAMNLDYDKRSKAPLYVDNSALLDETVERIITETFPLDLDPDGYGVQRLYVFNATEEG